MKKIKLLLFGLGLSAAVFAQPGGGQDPSVRNAVLDVHPFRALAQEANLSFSVGNSANGSIDGTTSQRRITFTVTFSKTRLKDETTILNSISGPGKDIFDFTYSSVAKTLIGTQKANVPIGPITDYLITLNIVYTGGEQLASLIDIGGTINLQVPGAVDNLQPNNDNISSFTYFELGAVPVVLTNFNAVRNGSSNTSLLTWSTSSEINSKQYDVYRSFDGATNWEKIGEVAAAGNSSTQRNYQLIDQTPSLTKKNYYRLKMIDLDATFKESTIRWVEFGTKGVITLYPNPVRSKLVINGIQTAREVALFDGVGKLLERVKVTGNSHEFNMERYAAGTYHVQVIGDNGETIFTSKVLKD